MASRTAKLTLAALALLALSACSSPAGCGEAATGSGGTIEMAVSSTCTTEADSQCEMVNGESVVLPSTFQQVGVQDSSVAEDQQSAVDVKFTSDGAKVWQELTEEAVDAGDSARLLIRIGDKLQTAVRVMDASTDDQVQIALSADVNAQDLVDLIG